ncbi:Fc.00g092600.m01.CDS01 [Cosmosporella sp. VM-42]
MEYELYARSDGSERPPFYKAVGISLAIGSGVFIGISFVLKKVGLLRANDKYNEVAGEGYGYLKNAYWWGGMTLMIIGEICNFVAYAFTDAILVTPLGALSVVITTVLSAIFLKERLSMVGKVGCFLCIVGSVVIVMNAPQESSVADIQEMQHFVIAPGFLTFAGLIIIGSAIVAFFVAPRYGKKNMLVYISICSWVGGLSVVATQGLGAAIIAWIGGKPQYKEWFLWVLFVFVIATLLTEIIFLNKALNLFNAALVTPTYYVYFTSTTIITSAILFQGFKGTVNSIVTVVMGFLVICSGVVLLQLSKSAKDVPDAAVFSGDLDQIHTIAEQEQSETEPKADAIRGAAAIVRRISQHRQKMEADELRRLHEEKMMMDAMEPISEDGQSQWEWDGLRRRRTMTVRTTSTRSRAATSPPPSGSMHYMRGTPRPYTPRSPRPYTPGQHPPLGMSAFPEYDENDDEEAQHNSGGNLFSNLAGTIRGRARTNASAPNYDEFSHDKARSPMHPVPLTEIVVPHQKPDDEAGAYYGKTREHVFNNQDTGYLGAGGSGQSLAPTPPPHSARRQFSFQRVFRRSPAPQEEPTEEERVGLVKEAERDSQTDIHRGRSRSDSDDSHPDAKRSYSSGSEESRHSYERGRHPSRDRRTSKHSDAGPAFL